MDNYYVRQILKVLVYIDDHIEEEMTMEELAKIAYYSPFHFHRIFQLIVGESVHKYVRRLRLETAASKLRHSREPITDIALDSNFDTPSAFTRAFKQSMGRSPRSYRILHKEVNAMTKKIHELAMIQPEKIEKIEDVHLLFIRRKGNYETSSQEAWEAMFAFIEESRLDKSKLRYFSIGHDDPEITGENDLRFDACIQAPQGFQERGEMGRQTLKGGKYAVFLHHGSPDKGMGEIFDRIILKWLPNNREKLDDSRQWFSEHLNLTCKDESKMTTKIYLPVF